MNDIDSILLFGRTQLGMQAGLVYLVYVCSHAGLSPHSSGLLSDILLHNQGCLSMGTFVIHI